MSKMHVCIFDRNRRMLSRTLRAHELKTQVSLAACLLLLTNNARASLAAPQQKASQTASPISAVPDNGNLSPEQKKLLTLLDKAASRSLTSHDLNEIYYGSYECSDLLMPCINLDAKFISDNSNLEIYPLHGLLNNSQYQSIVGKLINSPHSYNQALGFIVAASAEDRTYVDKMLAALRKDEDYPLRTYGAAALLYLKHPDPQLLFEYLINHQNIEDLDLWSTYLWQGESGLNAISLEQLASTDPTACITALALLAKTKPGNETREKFLPVFNSLDEDHKIQTISLLQRTRAGNLKSLLAPCLAQSNLRDYAYNALFTSPTEEDRKFVAHLKETQEWQQNLLQWRQLAGGKDATCTGLRGADSGSPYHAPMQDKNAPMQDKNAPLPGCEAEFEESLKHLNYPLTDQYKDTRLYIKSKGNALYVNTNWNGLNIYKGHQLLLKDCHDFNDLARQATPVYYIDKTPQEKKARLYASMNVLIHESFFHDRRWQDFDFGPLTNAVLIKNGKAQPIARDSIKTKKWKKTSTSKDHNMNQVD